MCSRRCLCFQSLTPEFVDILVTQLVEHTLPDKAASNSNDFQCLLTVGLSLQISALHLRLTNCQAASTLPRTDPEALQTRDRTDRANVVALSDIDMNKVSLPLGQCRMITSWFSLTCVSRGSKLGDSVGWILSWRRPEPSMERSSRRYGLYRRTMWPC